MSYIAEIFNRLDIQQIREFLLYGVECGEVSQITYEQRINKSEKNVDEIIKSKFPEMNEYEEIINEIHHYASETQNVYMEIGIQYARLSIA